MKQLLAILIMLVSVATTQAQVFDLLAVKSNDKVAKSRLFIVDGQKMINTYNMPFVSVPAKKTGDSLFRVEAVRYQSTSTHTQPTIGPAIFTLDQNYPNPFNPSTTIRFTLAKKANISVVLYDVTGKEISTLVADNRESGSHAIRWDGKNNQGMPVASGTYLYRLVAMNDDGSTSMDTKKMALLR